MDWQAETRKMEYLDHLYIKDGRDSKEHPHHARYTGLWLNKAQQLTEAHRDEVTLA